MVAASALIQADSDCDHMRQRGNSLPQFLSAGFQLPLSARLAILNVVVGYSETRHVEVEIMAFFHGERE
jgi:hypothetical protein